MILRLTKKRVIIGLASGLCLTLAAIMLIDRHVSTFSSDVTNDVEQIPSNKVGLLLGTSKYAYGRHNLYFTYRVKAAAELYLANKVDCILVSGDNSTHDYNEPQDMKDALIASGVPETDIYLDYAGFSTLDSVVRAKEVFHVDALTIISQKFHCERAIYLAKSKGIDAVGFNAKDFHGPLALRVKLREYLARVKAFIDLNVLDSQPKFLGDDPYQLGSR
ncbi:MAG: vancomycin high temperature exclusion protein [Planctomycetaceae bacterium]